MNTMLRCHGVHPSRELRDHVKERVRAALSRFAADDDAIWVTLFDVNGPRGGGDDILCRIRIQQRLDRLIVEERGPDPFKAVSLACARGGYALARRVEKRRNRARRQRRLLPAS